MFFSLRANIMYNCSYPCFFSFCWTATVTHLCLFTHVSPHHLTGQLLIARGHVLKAGKTLFVCRSDIYVRDHDNHATEKLCATSLNTLMALHSKKNDMEQQVEGAATQSMQ